MTFGSLFAGIGGLDLGLERAGMKCRWQVEIEPFARRVLNKHWPDVRQWDDVRTWPQPDTEPVDLIAGGFPCQDISVAGNGAGIDGERSGLFFELMRIVRVLRPRIVLLENVPALLDRGMGRVLRALAEGGYDAEWECLPASCFGAYHNRDRLFILAHREGAEVEVFSKSRDEWRTQFQSRRLRSHFECEKARRGQSFESEPELARMVDVISSQLDVGARCRGLGNAVVPQVGEWIGRRIMEAIETL